MVGDIGFEPMSAFASLQHSYGLTRITKLIFIASHLEFLSSSPPAFGSHRFKTFIKTLKNSFLKTLFKVLKKEFSMVGNIGFEPMTPCL